jgi:uncharacterized RDD family membrane protein YckC
MTEKRIMKLASRGKRFGAACIDSFIPVISYLLYSAVMTANGIGTGYPGYGYGNGFGYGYEFGYGYGGGMGRYHLSGASAVLMAVVFIVLLAYIIAEFIFFAKGKSIGKALLGLQVVSSKDGKPFRFGLMLFRELIVKSASGSALGIGYIWVLIDEKNRGWHDKILDSYVVDLKESERMNLRRHLEQARAAAPKSEPVVPETETVIEPVVEITSAPAEDVQIEDVKTEDVQADEVQPNEDIAADISDGSGEAAATETAAEETQQPADEIGQEPETEAEIETESETAGPEETTEVSAEEITALSMSMKKEELLEAAKRRGVQVSSRATKAAIIEAIEKAAEASDNE